MIDPSARIGAVHLTISDLDRAIRFYETRLGFRVHRSDGRTAALGAGGPDLLVLSANPSAPHPHGTTGLYHFAILVPGRAHLAHALRRLIATDTPMQGAADHGVSEALYLADPDGNGIEVYRDRPRADWPIDRGQLRMFTEALDFNDLLALPDQPDDHLPEGTTIGHVHLHVGDLSAAEHFYAGIAGFGVKQRLAGSALFVAAGDYHHHVGLNTWAGVGAPPPPPGAIGIEYFVVRLPTRASVDDVVSQFRAADVPVDARETGVLVRDPSSNAILLTDEQT